MERLWIYRVGLAAACFVALWLTAAGQPRGVNAASGATRTAIREQKNTQDMNTQASKWRQAVLERFLRYVRIDTQSDPRSGTYPSTAKQLQLLNQLAEEMMRIGVSDVSIDGNGYVTGRIPATPGCEKVPSIAFIAHVDTSPDVSGKDVQPRVVDYTGGDVVLSEDSGLRIPAADLKGYEGRRIVVTDGSTLLGADDKAGVAEIMTAAERLLARPGIRHGEIRILFTPDEEVGRGVDHFDVAAFGAKYGYTVDGGASGSLEYETFNAAAAKIVVQGINVHPGAAKDKMINSQYIAMRVAERLPADERPETTEGREGFFHLTSMEGDVERTVLEYIIRDHDRTRFEARKRQLERVVREVNEQYASSPVQPVVALTLTDQYYNMGEVIAQHPLLVEIARQAMREAGVEPVETAVRGGTDGSRLSFMGLPCPNIFSGAENMHSRKEFVSVETMEESVDVIVGIARLFCAKFLQE